MLNPFLSGELPFVFIGWAWLAWAVPAAITLAGGLFANRASAKEADANRQFQDELSRTAHQREVADLRAAGLNPILSGTGGRGATTPPGSMATMRNPAEGVASAAAAGMQARQGRQQIQNLKADERLREQQLRNADQENKILVHETVKRRADSTTAYNAAHISTNQKYMSDLDAKIRERALKGDLDEAEFWSSSAYGIKRRADAGLETARKLIPFTSPGGRPVRGGKRGMYHRPARR